MGGWGHAAGGGGSEWNHIGPIKLGAACPGARQAASLGGHAFHFCPLLMLIDEQECGFPLVCRTSSAFLRVSHLCPNLQS
ncbi:MAG TPA: hypothetical protein VFK82_10395, partial [Burkholderiaceae bacterium]|nr:hypothetical protein [Burkholderiaceae bacterium]